MKYLAVNARFPGSVHESEIWTTSPVRAHLRNTYTEENPSVLLGNIEYPLEPWLLTPIVTQTPTPEEVQYNLLHQKTSNIAERTIEATRARFRCLLKTQTVLHYSPSTASMITNAVCTLHNLTICLKDFSKEDEIEADADNLFQCKNSGFESRAEGNYFINGVRFRNNYIAQLFG